MRLHLPPDYLSCGNPERKFTQIKARPVKITRNINHDTIKEDSSSITTETINFTDLK